MRVGIFNVKYSPNLGDGLLSECLERELRAANAETTVISLDLAGRMDYVRGGSNRGTIVSLLAKSPRRFRHFLVETILGRSLRLRMRPYWKSVLRDLDAVVVGGGNLFGDNDLNFPLKIHAALDETRRSGIPAAVFGVGVSDNWSPRGEDLFRRAVSGVPLVYASVREATSQSIWDRRLVPAGILPARLNHDPGLLVSRHIPQRGRNGTGSPLVGIGVTHPAVLRYHADERSLSEADLTVWFKALVGSCLSRGWRVALFTNGSPEDDAYLKVLHGAVVDLAPEGRVSVIPRFNRPVELASFISGLDLLMAHRLHANITAYSYRIPHVGFSWDTKLKSFFARMGRSEFVCTAGRDSPEQVAGLAERAWRSPIDAGQHDVVLADASSQVAALSAHLLSATLRARDVEQRRGLT